MTKPKVELAPHLVEAISCLATFLAVGFEQSSIQTLFTASKIVFLFMFGDDKRYEFEAATLPEGSDPQQVADSWRPALQVWNSLSKVETNYLIATSAALQTTPPFMEMLLLNGHMPEEGLDGRSNDGFAVPCPYCKETLLFQYHLHRPTVGHAVPPCLGFLQNGPDRTVEELNRRGQMRMEGFSGEVPSHRPEPS